MDNLRHCSCLGKDNKSKNHIKSNHNKSGYFNPESGLEKINKIKIHIFYFNPVKSPTIWVASLGFGTERASKFASFPAVWTSRVP